ncbi:MAG TPA: hypothetical protein VF704_12850 [Allosphingosinicella sp.]
MKPNSPRPGPCSLTIAFGSYAMGIDRPTFEAVEALLAADPAVTGIERSRRGREGEVELCVTTAADADAERLLRRIEASLPADPRGPISATTRTGLSARAPARGR